ncbi:MAG: sulfur oxidation c-type cytochrome SoxA [Xanthobacteraceae bacterium]
MNFSLRAMHLAAAMLAAGNVFAAEIPLADRHSGYVEMSRDARAMQDDDTINPATFAVLDGETLWGTKAGAAQKSCAECHGDATITMKGVVARYPAFDENLGKAVDLEARVNLCQRNHQQAEPFAIESKDMLAITAFVARQSRGMPVAPDETKMAATIEVGRAIFNRRQGQLNLSCAQCHDDNWDRKLAGSPITQAHPVGYPLYRLEWQGMGSLQRRLRSCMSGIRTDPYAFGSDEYTALEAFLMWRARGMNVEAPAVRP